MTVKELITALMNLSVWNDTDVLDKEIGHISIGCSNNAYLYFEDRCPNYAISMAGDIVEVDGEKPKNGKI